MHGKVTIFHRGCRGTPLHVEKLTPEPIISGGWSHFLIPYRDIFHVSLPRPNSPHNDNFVWHRHCPACSAVYRLIGSHG